MVLHLLLVVDFGEGIVQYSPLSLRGLASPLPGLAGLSRGLGLVLVGRCDKAVLKGLDLLSSTMTISSVVQCGSSLFHGSNAPLFSFRVHSSRRALAPQHQLPPPG
jgi:hypothetical protein